MGNERGSVTILIALLAAVILALGLSFNWLVKEHIKTSEGLREKADAIVRTRSAYDTLIYLMLSGQVTEKEIVVDQRGITSLKSIPLDGSEVMISDGVFVRVQDSNGRLSLTTLSQDALKRLVSNETDSARGALFLASFLDWIDRDDLARVNGAEAPYYKSHGAAYTPRNYDLQYPEELALIRGVDADLYKRISPSLTILPNTGFNPNTASDSVLKAFLNIDDSRVAKIRAYIAIKTIKTMADLVALTGKMFYLEEPQGWFTPSLYMDIIVRAGNPRSLYKINAGLTIGEGIFYPYFIHYWQENSQLAKWQAAYWGAEGVDIYQMADEGGAELLYSGPLNRLKPMRKGMQRRILVLGRNNVIRLRKQYPPVKIDKLIRAVEMEAPTLFPLVNCSFHCRIVETYSTHVILDIWAWEREPLELLRKSFAFQYVIPEDLTFLASPSGIHIYPSGSMIQVIASGEGRFTDAASYPVADFSNMDLERFLTGLADCTFLIKEIRFFGIASIDVPPSLASCVKRFPKVDYPPFLAELKGLSLKSFRLKTGIYPLNLSRTVLLRFALYTVLAYGLMLFLTLKNYDKILMGLKTKSIRVEKEISLLDRGGMLQERPEMMQDYQERVKASSLPLRILDVLAADLPEESYVKNLVFNNGLLEVTVSARDPISLIKQLGSREQIEKVSLKGSPVKETSTGIYDCALLLEIKP